MGVGGPSMCGKHGKIHGFFEFLQGSTNKVGGRGLQSASWPFDTETCSHLVIFLTGNSSLYSPFIHWNSFILQWLRIVKFLL